MLPFFQNLSFCSDNRQININFKSTVLPLEQPKGGVHNTQGLMPSSSDIDKLANILLII